MAKRALLFGISGQDGSFLAELLLSKGYEVHGVIRRSSSFNTGRIEHLYHDPHESGASLLLHYGDLADAGSIRKIVSKVQPDELYNLGAMSHVRISFDIPEYAVDIDALGVLRLLEAVRELAPTAHVYQASSSEMFGSAPPPQNELTPFHPRSPYGCAKIYAYHQCVNYREAYGLFVTNGILYNHESERRSETFVSRKITRAATRIAAGLQDYLYLGNLEARRDWGYAPEYTEAMWLMMQQDKPDDYVIATGESHTVQEFVELAFSEVGLDWSKYVRIDPRYYRPTEVDHLLGDASKAKRALGWRPKTTFKQLVRIMVECDMRLAAKEAHR